MDEQKGMPIQGIEPPEWLAEAAGLIAAQMEETGDAERLALARSLEEATGLSAGELIGRLAAGATLRVQADGEGDIALARSLAAQESERRGEEPGFDLAVEMASCPGLGALLAAGEGLAAALLWARPEQAREAAERDVLERIRKRNLRPLSMGAGAAALAARPEGLTERQMREIDEKLKRGVRVRLTGAI